MAASLPYSPEDLFRRIPFAGDEALQLKLGFSRPDLLRPFFVAMPCALALRTLFSLMGRCTPPPAAAWACLHTTLQPATPRSQ
jgi:hypothetical protein